MYSLTYNGKNEDDETEISEKEKKVAKGIVKSEIRKTLRHSMYTKCLFEETKTMNSMRCIQSKNHELFIDLIIKTGLRSFDDKRYWKNPIDSYAYGHYKIKDL